jgi:hypothetical protein
MIEKLLGLVDVLPTRMYSVCEVVMVSVMFVFCPDTGDAADSSVLQSVYTAILGDITPC